MSRQDSRSARAQLAKVLKQAREKAGYSVRSLAANVPKASGGTITGSFISDIENLRGVPSDAVARNICEVLQIDSETFLRLCRNARAEH